MLVPLDIMDVVLHFYAESHFNPFPPWNGPDYEPIEDDDEADEAQFNECYEAAISYIQEAFISMDKSAYKFFDDFFAGKLRNHVWVYVVHLIDQDWAWKAWLDIMNIPIYAESRRWVRFGQRCCGQHTLEGFKEADREIEETIRNIQV